MVVVPNYALCPAVTIEHDHAADGAGAGLDLPPRARARRRPAAHRRRRAFGRRPPRGDDAGLRVADGRRRPAGAPGARRRCRSRACSTWSRCATRRSCRPTCASRAASAKRLSPALMPAPQGTLAAVVGGDESEEFLRQNAADPRRPGAPRRVPVCEAIPGTNHLTVLHDLADAQALGCIAWRAACSGCDPAACLRTILINHLLDRKRSGNSPRQSPALTICIGAAPGACGSVCGAAVSARQLAQAAGSVHLNDRRATWA